MPEARDRRERPVDYPAAFLNRRSHGILLDEPPIHLNPFHSPVQRPPSESLVFNQGSTTMGRGGIARGNLGIRRTSGGVRRRGRARASASVLPSWYPRTPLRDVSSVVRAIERRRARMGDTETPTPQQLGVLDDSLGPPLSGEHNYSSMVTPGPSVGFKRPWPPSTAKVHQILLDITRQSSAEEEEALTPEKKLLNSIDKVEKVVMEEIQKMKSTPSAKRAEREKRVRTLMSMR
ncbi:Protein POLYCHOME [Hirschfeldia incana]|nr:Protein POLYCHOME [Hirschfeldia incana]